MNSPLRESTYAPKSVRIIDNIAFVTSTYTVTPRPRIIDVSFSTILIDFRLKPAGFKTKPSCAISFDGSLNADITTCQNGYSATSTSAVSII